MDLVTFAAARRERLERADDELEPFVVSALTQWTPEGEWFADLVEAAEVLWLETFLQEAPNADPDRFMPKFKDMLGDSLSKTTKPTEPPSPEQVHRITYWLSTVTVNNATYFGNGAHGGDRMRWLTMNDEAVRGLHRAANGQIADRDGTFDIGGHDLHYPGEPVGPPEVWINCRCVLTPARVEGAFDVTTITAAGPWRVAYSPNPERIGLVFANYQDGEMDEELVAVDEAVPADPGEDELVEDVLDDDEEAITEIPVHGIIAPEAKMSGDYRMFADESVTNRILPLPLRYEFISTHGGTTSEVVTVGRVDKIWRDGDNILWDGAIALNRSYAPEVIDGLLDKTIRGVSLDGDMAVAEIAEDESGQMMTQDAPLVFSEIRVAALTIVPIPAFEEAFIALGHWEEAGVVAAALADCGCTKGPEDEDDATVALGYDAFRDVESDERKRLADEGKALPDGSYPISNVSDLRNAIQSIGRAKDPEAAKAHIKKRAQELGEEDLIPEDWSVRMTGADDFVIVDLTAFSEDELAEYRALPVAEQDAYAEERGAIVASTLPIDFAPGTKDGPGWITHPIPTSRIRRYWVAGKGAAKIRWGAPGDFNRCRRQLAKYVQNPDWLAGLCANMHKEAIGVWPGQEGGGRAHSLMASARPMSLVAAGTVRPAEAFKNPRLDGPTPITIEGDRIFGHLATWGVCHIGIQDACVTAPHSITDYAMFRTGAVMTDEGRVPVGQITMGTGHANIRAASKDAVAHYDHTGTAVADVAAGEDSHGIWIAGLLRPGVTDDQADALQAAALSGDWRRVGANLELVAALAVNVPGFPIPRASLAASGDMGQESLVAAGIVRQHTDTKTDGVLTAPEIAGIIRATVAEVRAEEEAERERERRLAALQPFAAKAREHVLTKAKERFEKAGV